VTGNVVTASPAWSQRRIGRPDDVAAACAFLVRDGVGYITGQVFGVNGGRTLV
jgi:NAD(P)-dependent dehydrogenase (short-subunit alcohol dehydrogenase family)